MASDWNRLTRVAKRAVVSSGDLALSLGSASVEPEHVLLTLLDDPGCSAWYLAVVAGFPLPELQAMLEERLELIDGEPGDKPIFSNRTRDLVTAAASLAKGSQAGTEHLLLAALSPEGELAPALMQAGASLEDLTLRWDLLEGHELHATSAAAASEPAARPIIQPAAKPQPTAAPEPAAPEPAVLQPAVRTPSVPSATAGQGSHTVAALARLVIDLAASAAAAARENGKVGVADQLDRMRSEAQAQIRSLAANTSLPRQEKSA